MCNNNEWQEEYERRFNAYMTKIVSVTYRRFIKKRKAEIAELILNEYIGDGIERADTLMGEKDVRINEPSLPKKSDFFAENENMNNALELLTENEWLVIFLSKVGGYSNKNIAKKLNMHPNSVGRVKQKGLRKMKK